MKKFAVVNAWPNLPKTAEREFISRLQIAGARVGWDVVCVNTSAEIDKLAPTFVLATHEYTPKLTSYPTVGAMWSPPEFFENDNRETRCQVTYSSYKGFTEESIKALLCEAIKTPIIPQWQLSVEASRAWALKQGCKPSPK